MTPEDLTDGRKHRVAEEAEDIQSKAEDSNQVFNFHYINAAGVE